MNGVTGQPAGNASVSVIPRGGTRVSRSWQAAMGRFDIPGVTPRSYEVTAQTTSGERLMARALLEIGDRDIENLDVILRPFFKVP